MSPPSGGSRRSSRRAGGRQRVRMQQVITFGSFAPLLVLLLVPRLGSTKDARAVRRVGNIIHWSTDCARQQLQPWAVGQLFCIAREQGKALNASCKHTTEHAQKRATKSVGTVFLGPFLVTETLQTKLFAPGNRKHYDNVQWLFSSHIKKFPESS